MNSRYTKTMAEAYAEVQDLQEQRRPTGAQRREAQAAAREKGNPIKDAVGAVTSRVGANLGRVVNPGKMKSDVKSALDASDAPKTTAKPTSGMTPDQVKSAQDKANADRRAGKMSDIRGSATPGSSTPAAAKPTPAATAAAPKPSGLNKDQQAVNKEYDRLRNSGDMKGAEAYGRKMHSAGASKSNFKMPSSPSSMGSAASKVSAPKFNTSTPAVKTPKINTPKMSTSSVKSPTPSFSAPKPAAAPKPMSRLDKATTGIKPMADQFEFKALSDAYDKMYQLDELFPGIAGGAGAAVGGALGLGGAAGAGTAGAIKGKDTKDKVKKAIGGGTGAAVGGALGGPIGAVIGGGIGDAVTSEQAEAAYEAWLQEQITAGKNFNSSGLDLRSSGQKMDNIKKSVKQNDKIQGLIQPPPGL